MPEFPSPVGSVPPSSNIRPAPPDAEGEEIDLGELLGVLYDGRWWIAAVTVLFVVLGGLYAFGATPIYRADALVQVEEKSRAGDPFKELTSMFSGNTGAEAELEIIRSRSVVSQVVERLRLDIEIAPKRVPLMGGFFARRYKGAEPAAPKLWMSSYAWGGEKLEFTELDVPVEHEGHPLTLIAEDAGAYRLLNEDGDLVLRGRAGELATGNGFRAEVSTLRARPGTEFSVTRFAWAEAIKDFQEDLGASEKGKNTGVIQLALEGEDKERIRAALEAVMDAYLRQNVKRRAEEAEKTLDFVQAQLPVLKQNLDEAEVKLQRYRAQSGKVDLSLEAEALLDRASELEKQLTALKLQKFQLAQRFTGTHPALVALSGQLASLEREKKTLEAQARSLPETELNSVRLMRDVRVANELYMLLLTKGQELGVMKSGTIGNVRVVDTSLTQPRPVSPKKALVLALSLLIGLGAGVGLTFVRKSLNHGVDDPEVLERALGLNVYATLPFSERHAEMERVGTRSKGDFRPLALVDPADLAVESLRSLRTSLQFSLAAARNKVVMIGGSRPGVGKSFVSVNLAYVLADTGKKVLLIDADLRKGQLHRYFGRKRAGGLSEVILGGAFDELVRKTEHDNLHFLAAGAVPPNPSELLASERFTALVAKAQESYDVVMIDTPPILAVTDAVVIARVVGVNLMVVRCGLHPVREIAMAVSRMEQSGARPNGLVFNGVPLNARGRFGKNAYHYHYDYR